MSQEKFRRRIPQLFRNNVGSLDPSSGGSLVLDDTGVLKIRRYFAARGLSCSVGELVEALAMREEWAQVMFASVKMRIEEQASERPTCYAQS